MYTISYRLSPEYLKEQEIATGIRLSEEVKVNLDPATLTPEQRAAVLYAQENYLTFYNTALDNLEVETNGDIGRVYPRLCFDHTLSQEELLAEVVRINALHASLVPDRDAKRAELKAEQKRRDREVAQEAEFIRRRQEEAEARKRAQAAAKQAQIATWVAKHGSQSQKERLAAGLLPEQEAIDALRDEAFAALAAHPLYNRLVSEDVEHKDECPYSEVSYDSSDAEDATEAQFEALKQIKSALPTAVVTLRTHTAECANCKATTTRAGILVVLTVGEFEFRREFAVPPPLNLDTAIPWSAQ